jgi:hypothetical protein
LLKYLLVYLVKQPNFDLMHNISCFSQIEVDEFIVKGEKISTKLVELFANRVVERRNTINST